MELDSIWFKAWRHSMDVRPFHKIFLIFYVFRQFFFCVEKSLWDKPNRSARPTAYKCRFSLIGVLVHGRGL